MKPSPWLAPLVPLYRLGLGLRELRLRTGLEPVRRLSWPVVSVGNLTAGGAGKTPMTIALAQALVRRSVHVDVLSRGYGRRSALPLRVDSRGTAEEFGDEPIEIAREAGVPVYVAAQRYEAGEMAEREATTAPGVHLLDDGFQHQQLYRDVNILLLGPGDLKNRLLPAGNLREPPEAMHRADVLAVPTENAPELAESVRKEWKWQGPMWRLTRTMDVPRIEGPVIAFCGIARPEQFFGGLRSAGLRPAECIAFDDHHRYAEHDLDRLRAAARSVDAAALVTTKKDRVRMGGLGARLEEACPLETAGLRIEVEKEDEAMDWLLGRLSSRLPATSA